MGDTADRLVELLEEKGLWIKYRPPDTLLLCGPKDGQTADVLARLKAHKPELLRRAKDEAGKAVAVPEKKPQPVTAEIEAACERCRATVYFPAAAGEEPCRVKDCRVCLARTTVGRESGGVFCDRPNCPHPRLGPEMRRSDTAAYKKW